MLCLVGKWLHSADARADRDQVKQVDAHITADATPCASGALQSPIWSTCLSHLLSLEPRLTTTANKTLA